MPHNIDVALATRDVTRVVATDRASTATDRDTAGLPISIHAVTKHYGDVRALDALDLEIRAGEFVTLLGPSGSGKTTLLMALAGFIRLNDGSIRFGNQEVIALPPHKRNAGMMFQSYALFPHMNVAENIAYPLKVRRVPRAQIAERVKEVLAMVRLSELIDRRIDQLSGGQRQRVALARAIVFRPRILLMDEPLSALDKSLREEMQIEIRNLQRNLGITTVSVTHDQREALTMGDRVAVLNRGKLVQIDTPERLYAAPATKFVAGFVGETTLWDVTAVNGAFHIQDRPLKTAQPIVASSGAHFLAIRSEKLEILDRSDRPDYNVFQVRVRDTVFQGDALLIYAVLPDGRSLTLRRTMSRGQGLNVPQPGDELRVGLHAHDTIIVPEGAA